VESPESLVFVAEELLHNWEQSSMRLDVLLIINCQKTMQHLIPDVFLEALGYTTLANAGTAVSKFLGEIQYRGCSF
jgi:hypothetical protein